MTGLFCFESFRRAIKEFIGLITQTVSLAAVVVLGLVSFASPLACFLLEFQFLGGV